MLKIYGHPGSRAARTLWVCRELGVQFEHIPTHFADGGTQSAAFLAINPAGRTPALVDGDFKLGESTAIMQYLASQKPNSLWPNDARTRADIMRWQSWSLAHWSKEGCEPLIFNRLVKKLLNLGGPDEAAVAQGTQCFNKEAAVLDAHLAKQPFLAGKELTLADFSVAAPLFYAKEAELPVGPYARVQEWFGRVSALSCWRETAPQFAAAAA